MAIFQARSAQPTLTTSVIGNDQRGALCAVFLDSGGITDRDNQIAFMSAVEGNLEAKGYQPFVREIAPDDEGIYYNDRSGRPVFEIVKEQVELLLIHPDRGLSDNNLLIDVMDATANSRALEL